MSELRQDLLTGRWVVLAPSRGDRPIAQGRDAGTRSRAPHDPACPFCPGNEAELPSIRWEAPGPGPHGWACRAVPNRYPAFEEGTGSTGSDAMSADLHEAPTPGYAPAPAAGRAAGRQEVLIESPYHDRDPGRMSPEEALAVLRAYRERLRASSREAPRLHPVLFRNHGRSAGASLPHPHAQLIGTRAEGPRRRILRERLGAYRRATGRCLLCGGPTTAPDADARIVEEDEHHVAYVPWAAERPLEVRIVPRRHEPGFRDVEGPALESLARLLGRLLGRLRRAAADPDYNYVLHTWGEGGGEAALHWHLQIRPRTSRMAGFELGTGMFINPSSPVGDAEILREAGSVRDAEVLRGGDGTTDPRGKGEADG